jgi:hypothetical protein
MALTKVESIYKAPKQRFVPVVINNKLVFRFDPERGLIEWQCRGEKHIIDLAEYAEKQNSGTDN